MKKYWALSLAGPAILLLGWMCVARVPPGHFAIAGSRELTPGWSIKPFWNRARLYAEAVSLRETLSLRTREGAARDVKVSVAFAWNRAALKVHPSSEEAVRSALQHPSWLPGPSLRREIEGTLAAFPVADLAVAVDLEGELPEEVRAAFHPTQRKIVFLGLDAMDWILVDKLIADGKMPTFARLKREGAWALEQSSKPLLSPLIWTSIATSRPPDEHGVLDFTIKDPSTGAQVPITSRYRKVQAFWNILSAFGLKVNVVGWWATFPSEKIRGTMVSERLFFSLFGIEPPKDVVGNTYPPDAEKIFKPLMVNAQSIPYAEISNYVRVSEDEYRRLWDEGRTQANPFDHPINHLRKILAVTHSVVNISKALLEQPFDVTALYLEGPDTMGHRFAHLMPPKLPWVSQKDFEMGKEALPRYYEEMDRVLTDLMKRAPADTLWIIASDHGFFTGEARPSSPPDDFTAGAAEWHRLTGLLIITGPGVRPGQIAHASIYDLIPTMFDALGVPASREWKGRALTEAFTDPTPVRTVASYEFLPSPWKTETAAAPDAERMKELQALGYIGGAPREGAAERPHASSEPEEGFSQYYNKANALFQKGDSDQALGLYLKSVDLNPGFSLGMFSAGQCYALKKDHAEAYRWIKKSLDHPHQMPPQALLRLMEEAGESGQVPEALAFVESIRPQWERESAFHVALGLGRAALGEGEEAAALFEKALSVNAADPRATEELLQAYIKQGRIEKAAELLKRAWDASNGNLRNMNALGLVCLKNGEGRIAEEIFRLVLRSDPDNAGVVGNLAVALKIQGRTREACEQFEQAARLQPDNSNFWYNVGACLSELGRPQESLTAFLKAKDLNMSQTKLYIGLGHVYFQLGQKKQAREALQKALALDPTRDDARKMLETLK